MRILAKFLTYGSDTFPRIAKATVRENITSESIMLFAMSAGIAITSQAKSLVLGSSRCMRELRGTNKALIDTAEAALASYCLNELRWYFCVDEP